MKTLLRSCFAADPTDKLDLLAANFELLEKSPVPRHWANPEDTAIYVAIRSFVQTHGHVPGVQALRAQFSAAREVDAVDRLERLALAKPLVRGNFATHLELLVRDRRAAALAEIAKQEIHILHQRCEVEEPDERGQPRKLRLHGEGDARAWGERARARLEADWPSRTERELNWVRGDQLVEREQEWLWYGYLAEGKVTLVEGPGSIGKSTVVSDLVARLTSGAPMPGEAAGLPPRDVVWITTEEDPATDTLPRLRLAGADLSRLHFRAIDQHWDARKLAELLELCDQLENPVVVIDALKDTLPGVKDYEEISVRAHMLPLVRACHEKNITMLPIRHWKEGGSSSVRAWRRLGRVAQRRVRDDQRGTPRGRDVRRAREAARRPEGTGVAVRHRPRPGGTPQAAHAVPAVGPAREDIDADDLAMAQPESREERSRLQEAKDLLEVALAKGPRKGTAVETEALAADISRASLRRAREALCRVEAEGRRMVVGAARPSGTSSGLRRGARPGPRR